MNSRINTVNGNEVAEFKELTDFFRMEDGVFWTIEALAVKYKTASNTIYKKAKDYKIPMRKILGVTCFMDDDRFTKQKTGAGNVEHLQGKGLMSYAELHRKIEELIKLNQNYPLEQINANTNDCFLKLDDVQFELKEIKTALNQILDHLTKEKKNG